MKQGDPIIEALDQIKGLRAGSELPGSERLALIQSMVTGSLTPVRPLPSNRVLISLVLGGFLAFSLFAAVGLGFGGYRHLSSLARLEYYGAILLSATLLSTALVEEIIPGSRRRVSSGAAMALSVVTLALVVLGLFPEPDLTHFVKVGLPCLKLGTLCAAVSGIFVAPLLWKGFSTSIVRSAATAGFLAGLAGFAVLALRCSVQNFAHILVWHVGALLVGVAGGALIGFWRAQAATNSRPRA